MLYRLFWLVGFLLLPVILFSQIDISLQEKKQYVIFEVTSPFPVNLLETEKISGGEAITIAGENIQLSEKFSQHTLNHSFIKYIIQNQIVKNHVQFILKEGRAGFSYYINTALDSLYRFQIHIFPESRDGKDPVALYLKGVDYHRDNQLNMAIQYYRKSIRMKAQNGNAYYKAGQIRLLKNEYNNALINFNKAIRFQTDSLKAYDYLARLYDRKKNQAKAEQFSSQYQTHQARA